MTSSTPKNRPTVGLLGCCSNASNSGALVSKILVSISKELGDDVGILSLPALFSRIPRQVMLAKNKVKYILVVDGCHQRCASKVAKSLNLRISAYVNLEEDLKIRKKGPFTTHDYSEEDYVKAKEYVIMKVRELLARSRELGT